MHGRRAVKGTVVEKRNRDRELTKDRDRTHTNLEGDTGGPLTVSVEVSTERWTPGISGMSSSLVMEIASQLTRVLIKLISDCSQDSRISCLRCLETRYWDHYTRI